MIFKHTFSQMLCVTYAIIILIMTSFVHVLLFLAYILLRPFNSKFYKLLTVYTQYMLTSTMVCISEFWATSSIKLYMDEDDQNYLGKEKALVIMNHSCEVDWILLNSLGNCFNVSGNCKYFIKKTVQYIPIIGTAMLLHDTIFLERSFEKDRANISKGIRNLADYPNAIWLILFAEGTRFSKKKLLDSLKFAKERNLPELKHHLYPRTKGFVACVPILKEGFDAVYNIEIVFSTQGGAPKLLSLIEGEHFEAHFYIKRIALSDVPNTKAERETFLMNMYLEKDRLQDSFISTGNFFKTSGVKEVPHVVLKRNIILPVINFMFWSFITMYGYAYFTIYIINMQSYIGFSLWIGTLIGSIAVLNKMIAEVTIKKTN